MIDEKMEKAEKEELMKLSNLMSTGLITSS
jgi:hypothetical protein